MKKLEWTTVKRKVKDLLPLEINPRTISEEKKKELTRSLEKFNLAEIPAINLDNKIIAGNQRVSILMLVGRSEEEIDVRIPNRQLTKPELKQYNLMSNTHAGEWDVEMLNLEFGDVLGNGEFSFDTPNLNLSEEKEREAVPFNDEKQWFLNIKCTSEGHAKQLYEQLLKNGLEVKIVT